MSSESLTRDNLHLSQADMVPEASGVGDMSRDLAINCKAAIPENVAAYVADSLSANTQWAYLSDLAHFESWGGSIPANPALVASYLAAHADTLSVATLVRMLVTVRLPSASVAPMSSTSPWCQVQRRNSGAKAKMIPAKRAGRSGMAASIGGNSASLPHRSLRRSALTIRPPKWPQSS